MAAEDKDLNRDPLNDDAGGHPVGTGVGAAGGAVAGAAVGAIGGPVGMAVGGVVGAIVGGLAGNAAAEAVNPSAEEAYWRESYDREPYHQPGRTFDDYGPAYRHGLEARSRYDDWDAAEPELASQWDLRRGNSSLDWDSARPASRAAWDRVDPHYRREGDANLSHYGTGLASTDSSYFTGGPGNTADDRASVEGTGSTQSRDRDLDADRDRIRDRGDTRMASSGTGTSNLGTGSTYRGDMGSTSTMGSGTLGATSGMDAGYAAGSMTGGDLRSTSGQDSTSVSGASAVTPYDDGASASAPSRRDLGVSRSESDLGLGGSTSDLGMTSSGTDQSMSRGDSAMGSSGAYEDRSSAATAHDRPGTSSGMGVGMGGTAAGVSALQGDSYGAGGLGSPTHAGLRSDDDMANVGMGGSAGMGSTGMTGTGMGSTGSTGVSGPTAAVGAMQQAGNASGDREDTIDVLQDLVETCRDGEYGFQQCAEHAQRADLRTMFQQRVEDCRRGAEQLQEQIRSLGGHVPEGGSVLGSIHRGWVATRAAMTSYDDKAMLEEAERGEDNALARYRKALQKPLPEHVRQIVQKQCDGVQRNHDEVKRLRNEVRAQG